MSTNERYRHKDRAMNGIVIAANIFGALLVSFLLMLLGNLQDDWGMGMAILSGLGLALVGVVTVVL